MSKININDPRAWHDLSWDEPEVPDLLKKTDGKVAVARANRLTKTTKEFREKITEKNRNQAQDPNWLEATTRASQRKAQDPKWLESNIRGVAKRKQRGQELKEQGKIEEFRQLFGVKDQHTEETKTKMSASAKDRWAKSMRKVYAQGKVYSNIYEAGQALGIHKDTVTYRMKSKPKEYYFID